MMLDARGNLDLESLEELFTSSGTPGPAPLRANSFLAFYFCIIIRDVLLFCFLMDFDLHVGAMLASFSMFVDYFFDHRFYMDLSSILQGVLFIY